MLEYPWNVFGDGKKYIKQIKLSISTKKSNKIHLWTYHYDEEGNLVRIEYPKSGDDVID